jgi:hypothetical protein
MIAHDVRFHYPADFGADHTKTIGRRTPLSTGLEFPIVCFQFINWRFTPSKRGDRPDYGSDTAPRNFLDV